MAKGRKLAIICPKCGTADKAPFLPNGTRKCECGFVGTTARFRRGGPREKHRYSRLDDPRNEYIGSGCVRKGAVRYD
jgi:hypothetical protein